MPISCSVASSPAYQRASRYSVAFSIATARCDASTCSAVRAAGVKGAAEGLSMFSTPTRRSWFTSGSASSATTPGKNET